MVNSGSLEDENNDTEDDKTVSTDYGKIAKALNEIINAGINGEEIDSDINIDDDSFILSYIK